MVTILSKEVLSEVLGVEAKIIKIYNDEFWIELGEEDEKMYNMYQLAHLCKVWAYRVNEYSIESGCDNCSGWAYIRDRNSCSDDQAIERVIADTEVEAIFKATMWIYNKEKNNGC